MREAVFIKQNIEKWRKYEALMPELGSQSPDYLVDVYTDLSSDLSFARSHYPNSQLTPFLNDLTLRLHRELYKVKREPVKRLWTFWRDEVPLAMWRSRRELSIALLIFILSIAIGVISSLGDESFPRLIMGDDYIDMTIDNIENGEPMGVYGTTSGTTMFLGIAYNNIRVAFMAFALGLLTSLGSAYILISNGIMLGAFLTFFVRYRLLGFSALTVMMHGTLELTAIVVAGGAGIVMGNGWLFPGTYSRLQSFRRSAMHGLKVVAGTVPVLLLAAVIESFVTRHTGWPLPLKLSVIIVSALMLGFYYIYLPVRAGRSLTHEA